MFAKLDSSQMASVVAKELKYFTKQGGNIVFDGNYVLENENLEQGEVSGDSDYDEVKVGKRD